MENVQVPVEKSQVRKLILFYARIQLTYWRGCLISISFAVCSMLCADSAVSLDFVDPVGSAIPIET